MSAQPPPPPPPDRPRLLWKHRYEDGVKPIEQLSISSTTSSTSDEISVEEIICFGYEENIGVERVLPSKDPKSIEIWAFSLYTNAKYKLSFQNSSDKEYPILKPSGDFGNLLRHLSPSFNTLENAMTIFVNYMAHAYYLSSMVDDCRFIKERLQETIRFNCSDKEFDNALKTLSTGLQDNSFFAKQGFGPSIHDVLFSAYSLLARQHMRKIFENISKYSNLLGHTDRFLAKYVFPPPVSIKWEQMELFLKDYTMSSKKVLLGKGGFGEVFQVILPEGNIFNLEAGTYAFKRALNVGCEILMHEAIVLRNLRYPNITRLHGYSRVRTQQCGCIILSFNGVPLEKKMEENNIGWKLLLMIVKGIAYAFHCLTSHNDQRRLIHVDYKLNNVLVDEGTNAVLIDFGHALEEGEHLYVWNTKFARPMHAHWYGGGSRQSQYAHRRDHIYFLGVTMLMLSVTFAVTNKNLEEIVKKGKYWLDDDDIFIERLVNDPNCRKEDRSAFINLAIRCIGSSVNERKECPYAFEVADDLKKLLDNALTI